MKFRIAIILVIAALIILFYFYFDPATAVLIPKCPFKLLTGLDCPACGSQRAFHALLHGEIAKALSFNPFLVVSLPYLVAVALTTFCRGARVKRWRPRVQHTVVIWIYIVLFFGWWILRNLPLVF